ncbi:MAG: hypothetical protein ACE5H9_09185 [Anaerolineae bacterium]
MAQFLELSGKTLTDYEVEQISEALQAIKSNLSVINGAARLIRSQADTPIVDSDLRLILYKSTEIDDSLRRIHLLLHR